MFLTKISFWCRYIGRWFLKCIDTYFLTPIIWNAFECCDGRYLPTYVSVYVNWKRYYTWHLSEICSDDYDMDGMSLYPLLKNETQYTRDSFMIEYHGEGKVGNYQKCGDVIEDMYNLAICEPEWGCKCQDSRNNTYNCLRTMTNTENTLFCAFEDDVGHLEFYNLEEDLYQLHNLYENVKIQEKYFDTLETLKTCKGYMECNVI